jgi:hypothetical protein
VEVFPLELVDSIAYNPPFVFSVEKAEIGILVTSVWSSLTFGVAAAVSAGRVKVYF